MIDRPGKIHYYSLITVYTYVVSIALVLVQLFLLYILLWPVLWPAPVLYSI